jgi:Ca-activated chloride channel family protein
MTQEVNTDDATIVSPETSGDATIVSQGSGDATVVAGVPSEMPDADATVVGHALETVDLAELKPEVTLNLMLHNPYALAGSRSENYLLCELSGAFMGHRLVRPPVHLSVVLDKSGSMEGKPLEYVKEACRQLIDKLGPVDTLSIITFAEAVDVVLAQSPVMKKEALKAQLDLIRPRGTTNLYGGMVAGANQLATVKAPTHLARVILLTDGEANEGVTEYSEIIGKARQIRRDGFSISSVGVGIEYNEELMRGIAKNTIGNYYYVDAASEIPRVFETELATLFEVVAKNVRLSVDLPKGARLDKFYGRELTTENGISIVDLPDVVAGDPQSLLLKLAFDSHPAARFRILHADLSFEYLGQTTRTAMSAETVVQFTPDRQRILDSINSKVDSVMRVKDVVAEISRAKQLLSEDAGTATVIIDRAKTVLMQAGREGDATLIANAADLLASGEVEKADKTLGATSWELEE